MAAAESVCVDGKDSDEKSDNRTRKDDNELAENTDGKDDGEPVEDADATESNVDTDTEENYVPSGYLPARFIFFMIRGPLVDSQYRVDVLQLDNYLHS